MTLGRTFGLLFLALISQVPANAAEVLAVPGSLDAEEKECATQCSSFIQAKNFKAKGFDGTSAWGDADDQICAAVRKDACVNNPNDSRCASDGINYKIGRCKLHESQVETHCQAYWGALDSSNLEKLTVALDATAAGMCGAACFSPPGVNGGLVTGCLATGYMASASELIRAIFIKTKTEKLVGAAMGGGSAAMQFTALRPEGRLLRLDGNTQAYMQSPSTKQFYPVPSVERGYLLGDPATFGQPAVGASQQAELQAKQKAVDKKNKKNACTSAIMYGALTGIRAAAMISHGKTRKESCAKVTELLKEVYPQRYQSARLQEETFLATIMASLESSTRDPLRWLISSAEADSNRSRMPQDPFVSCMNDSKCFSEALSGRYGSIRAENQIDLQLLRKSGLGQMARQRAAALPMDRLTKHLEAGGTADAVIQAAAGQMPGNFGTLLASVAKNAQREAGEIGSPGAPSLLAEVEVSPQGETQSEQETPYTLMGERKLSDTPSDEIARVPSASSACASEDVLHSNCRVSIFQIVSDRYKSSTGRVESLGWSLDINRMLTTDQKKPRR